MQNCGDPRCDKCSATTISPTLATRSVGVYVVPSALRPRPLNLGGLLPHKTLDRFRQHQQMLAK
ncbi:MAG TPA: hypothetical protein VGN72_14530 [Tepidisphaeraceae bacterium]|jgi:hypothetical protein|nr:hypothetical protein [Tepidisphaeraceae bacterium]